jgi:putative flippase GtrA
MSRDAPSPFARPRVVRGARFGVVSMGSILLTQVLLAGLQLAGITPFAANAIAVSTVAVPAFLVSRRWVWRIETPAGRMRQGMLFWLAAVVGLVLSTFLVWAFVRPGAPVLLANVVNLGAFGSVWLVKYLFLDTVVFPARSRDRGASTGEDADRLDGGPVG